MAMGHFSGSQSKTKIHKCRKGLVCVFVPGEGDNKRGRGIRGHELYQM